MFFHKQKLQFNSKPEKPDAVYARKLQEVIGGQYGEITDPDGRSHALTDDSRGGRIPATTPAVVLRP